LREQIFEEGSDIQASEIACVKPDVKGQAPSLRRYRQGIDRGNPVLLVQIIQEGCLPLRGSGAGNVGNKQKARFIEKDQMGSKFFGFFMSGQR